MVISQRRIISLISLKCFEDEKESDIILSFDFSSICFQSRYKTSCFTNDLAHCGNVINGKKKLMQKLSHGDVISFSILCDNGLQDFSSFLSMVFHSGNVWIPYNDGQSRINYR